MRDRQTLLQDVFDTISAGIFVVDVESFDGSQQEGTHFRFVALNPAYARMVLQPTTTWVGLRPQDYFPQDIAETFCANYSRCLEQRQPISYQESFEIEERSHTLLTTLVPTIEPDGRISRIIGLSQDITAFRDMESSSKPFAEQADAIGEAKTARIEPVNEQSPVGNSAVPNNGSTIMPHQGASQEHQWSEDFLWLTQLSLDRSAVMACLVDQEARFLYVNDAACQLLGYSREELLSMRVGEVTVGFPPEAWAEHWQDVKQRRSFTFEAVKKTKDNRRLPVEISVNYFEFKGGEYNCVFVRDLTQHKQIEETLYQEKELLSTLIENAPIGIISTDESGKILLVNPAYEKICGYSSEELVGQTPPYPYWDLADLEKIYYEFELAMSGNKEQIELWFTRKNGERFLARLQPITIFDEQGNMFRHLATMEDITKYKQAEEELCKALERERELNELKSRFIAMISHEYRTPLATILSSAELLERYTQKFTEEQKFKHYRRIQSSVQELTELVNDVLDISKIEAGKQEFNPAPLNLDKFCHELVEELQLIIGKEHTLLFTNHSDGELALEGATSWACAYMDKKLLGHIITNLVSNAIKYSPGGSTVRFDLIGEQSQVILRIQDQGIGIPLADQQHLFQPFHRGSNVGNTSGTGLGLAIVKSNVDLHGGQIAVESNVGVGTTVTVTLPLHEPLTSEIEPDFSTT